MNQQLFEDSRNENIEPTIPNLQIPETSQWTPLHIACMFGKVDFARNFLQQNPEFLKQENPDGCSALHLASSYGHSQIVELLLGFRNPSDDQPVNIRELSLKKDKGGRNPLHHAVIKNHADVVKKLLVACPESALDLTSQEETVFHLAVKNIASPSVWLALLDGPYSGQLLSLADTEGNTVLHLAVVWKQFKVIIQLLERHNLLEVNAVNSSGLTPLDVLVIDPISGPDNKIEEIIISAGGIRLNESYEQRENLKNITSGLFLMASIGAAASCQIAVYLQGAYWSESTLNPVANVTSISNNSNAALIDFEVKYGRYRVLLFLDGLVLMFSIFLLVILLRPSDAKESISKWMALRFTAYFTVALFIALLMYLVTSRKKWAIKEIIIFCILLLFSLIILVFMLLPAIRMFRILYKRIRRSRI